MHLNQRKGVAIPREAALDSALAGAMRCERWALPCDASPTEGRAKGCPYRLGKRESPTPRVETAVFGEDPQAAVRDSLVGRGRLIPILGTPLWRTGTSSPSPSPVSKKVGHPQHTPPEGSDPSHTASMCICFISLRKRLCGRNYLLFNWKKEMKAV